MQKFTVRAVLRTDKENKKGECPIAICITIDRKRYYQGLGLSIDKGTWDKAKGKLKPNAQNASAYNTRISNTVAKIERDLIAADERGPLTIASAKTATAPAMDFYVFINSMIKDMQDTGHGSAAKRHVRNLPSIKSYAGDNLLLSDIDYQWLKGYERHCRSQTDTRKNKTAKLAQNTIRNRFSTLRKVMLLAVAEHLIPICPIGTMRGGYPMPAYEEVPKDYLTYDEVLKIFKLIEKNGLTETEDKTLTFFLVECTAGIRHSDWSRFQTEKLKEGLSLKVRAKKTGEPVYIPITKGTLLHKAITRIQKKSYIYTATEPALANKLLKHLMKAAGISKRVTTHTGRHTCATLLLEKGFSRETVAEVLGVSMKVIDVYAKMTRLKVKTEFERLGGL